MFTLKIGGKLDRFMKECDAWKNATPDEKVDGCFFLRSFMIASFKYVIGIAFITVVIGGVWVFFRMFGELILSGWLSIAHNMDKEQIEAFVNTHVIWFWFVPHIIALVTIITLRKLGKWHERVRSERRRRRELLEDFQNALPPPPPRAPNKLLVLVKALAGKACFKINVVK